jgi:type I restriction enzyme R subunit
VFGFTGFARNQTFPSTATQSVKVYVDGVAATILTERVEYLIEKARPITENLKDFTRKALETIFKHR